MSRSPARYDMNLMARTSDHEVLARLLGTYSVEVTARDADAAVNRLPPGTEVFIANLPKDSHDMLVTTAARLHRAGLVPVPHIVARKLRNHREFDDLIERLAGDAGVKRVLALGGDRDRPRGAFDASLQLVETGIFEKHGIRQIAIACYPEGHPRIGNQVLREALQAKLAAIDPSLRLEGVHFFTFGAPEKSIEWANSQIEDGRNAAVQPTPVNSRH